MRVPARILAGIGMVWAHAGLAADDPQGISSGTGEWRIGPASDPNCHFQDIQDAIDATIANDGGLSTISIRVAGNAALHNGNTYGIDLGDFENITTVNIIGGHEDCQGFPVSGQRTVLDADGNGRVFDLRYHADDSDPVRTVILQNLEITGGNPGFAGGGVRIEGHSGRQRVQFLNVDIHNNVTNSVGSGGGVSIEATEGSDSPTNWVSFSGGSSIRDNFAAGAGGGLACFNLSGQENPPVLLFETLINGNQAVFDGGGISISGCRNVSVRTQGMEHSVLNNQAGASGGQGDGGGLYLRGGGEVTVEASGTQQSAVVFGNLADHGGGASVAGAGSQLDLVNTRIAANTARRQGGGIFVNDSARWTMGRQGGTTGFPGDCLPLFDSDARCSVLSGNQAENAGGAVAMRGDSTGELNQTFINNNFSNTAGSVIFLAGIDTSLDVEGAVVHSNGGPSNLMHITFQSHLRVTWSTIAGNKREDEDLTVFRVISSDDNPSTRIELYSSIVWEPGAEIVSSSGSAISEGDCVIGHLGEDDSGFGAVDFYSQIDPRLVDPGIGDLRLQPSSPAVDYCDDATSPSHNDMFNNPRGVPVGGPVTEPPNGINADFDIGAHELQQPLKDNVFEDRFEES